MKKLKKNLGKLKYDDRSIDEDYENYEDEDYGGVYKPVKIQYIIQKSKKVNQVKESNVVV
jgi:hypothetical protein